jgi:hypothetical protein
MEMDKLVLGGLLKMIGMMVTLQVVTIGVTIME